MAESAAAAAAPAELVGEAVALLQRLIRTDTVNPPGNERPLQEELRELLAGAGFECELLAAEPDRPNLVARLRGRSEGPTLTLLGHVDTVRADPDEWSRDPWGAEFAEGMVWGRGALDMKGQVACEVSAALELARSGWRPPAGELLLVITADEEAGGDLGARWLCENHPDRVRSDYVVNEGGGVSLEFGGRRLYVLSVGEKGIFRAKLRTAGIAGHASLPRVGQNALMKLARLLTRLERQPPAEPSPEALAFLSALYGRRLEGEAGIRDGLERLREDAPLLHALLAEPMAGVTISPTKARAGEKANVIPSRAEALLDVRVPPGLGEAAARERIEAVLGDEDHELDFSEAVEGNRSPLDSPLAEAIGDWLAGADPDAELAPIVMPGFSDSHWFRRAFGDVVVYGFCPHREMSLLEYAPLIHGADERIAVTDVDLAARFFFDLPQRILG